MSPTSRWHDPDCTAPDTAVVDGRFLWCSKCESLFTPPVNPDAPTAVDSYVYDYESLASTDEVRILELSKGKSDDPLHGTLTRCRLQNFAAYEALSYTWACHDGDEPIDGTLRRDMIFLGPFWDAFLVTRNCYKALRRLRYPDRTRVLWVDSICINQENENERNHQVWLMQRIYENALCVVVYLGDENADSSTALQALHSPEKHLRLSPMSEERRALAALFQRPYFSRLWIVQEVALAKSLNFYCGSSQAFIPSFSEGTLESLVMLGGTVPAWMKYSSLRQSTAPRSLWSLLQDTNSCRCLDPRDKLFGILSLATADCRKELKPDYSLSIEEVYTRIAAFLIREVGPMRVLELATRTPLLKSLPSWVPNWAACSTISPRWTPDPFPNPFSSIRPILDHAQTIRVESYSDPLGPLHLASPDYPNCHVSVTGTVVVEGILFGQHAFSEPTEYGPLLLQKQDGTVFIAFNFARSILEPDDFILNHQNVLLLGPDYSQALVLEPVHGKEEFNLVKGGKFSAIIHAAARFIPPLKSLCMAAVTADELAFARNKVISWLYDFPHLRNFKFLWGNNSDESVVEVLQALLSNDFLTYYETETRIWAQWKELEEECMPTFLHPADMESIADYILSLKGSSDWTTFNNMGLTNFFALFILDPLKRCARARDMIFKGNSSNKGVSQNADPRHALGRLLHWEMYTFDLLRHMEAYTQREPARFIEVLPGQDLPAIARSTWDYHKSIARIECRDNPGWDGWYTWFMAKEIARQQLETKNIQGEDPKSELGNGTYWDWDHMKTTMDARIAILTELMEVRRRVDNRRHFGLHLLIVKLQTRRLMKEVGYDLSDDRVRHTSVTIR